MTRRPLGQPKAAYAGDTGEPDTAVRRALGRAAVAQDPTDYLRAVAALCETRLLLPIVATGDGGPDRDPDRRAEMAAVLLTSAGGATGVLAFTGLDSISAWDPGARPVPCTLDELAATAVETGSATVVVDIAGPSPLVIGRDLVAELAQERRLVELADGGWGWMFRAEDSSELGTIG